MLVTLYSCFLLLSRYLRVYSAAQKYKCVHSVNKMSAPDQVYTKYTGHVRVM